MSDTDSIRAFGGPLDGRTVTMHARLLEVAHGGKSHTYRRALFVVPPRLVYVAIHESIEDAKQLVPRVVDYVNSLEAA